MRLTNEALVKELEAELKVLKDKQREIPIEIEKLQNNIGGLQDKYKKLCRDIDERADKLTKLLKPMHITDHALLRYMERKLEMDVEKLRGELMTDDLKGAINKGVKKIKLRGVTFVIKDNAVVTVT